MCFNEEPLPDPPLNIAHCTDIRLSTLTNILHVYPVVSFVVLVLLQQEVSSGCMFSYLSMRSTTRSEIGRKVKLNVLTFM